VAEFAACCDLRPEQAKLILRGFLQAGVVAKLTKTRYAATPYGLSLSRGLTIGARDPVAPPRTRRAAA
jgi:hypothetical protein